MQIEKRKYVGFWMRLWASIVDTIVFSSVIFPLLFFIYGKDYLALPSTEFDIWYYILIWFFPAILVILCWLFFGASPGKLIIGAKIIDVKSGGKLTILQSFIRYLSYFISLGVAALGFLWIMVDDRKQGWHDKLASSVVVYNVKNRFVALLMVVFSMMIVAAFLIMSYFFLSNEVTEQLTASHDVTTGQYIAEGFEYGSNVSTSECWNQTWRRISECNDIRCEFNQSYFLKACMGASYATAQSYR